ncbi:MAG: hypothetical protein ABIR15_09075 [Chitinophagaceae bacterium]
MKFYITILIILISLHSNGQGAIDSVSIRTNDLLEKAKQHVITDIEKRELAADARYFQNKGFEFDEMQNDYRKAFEQTEKAIIIYVALKDSVNEANLLKYKGFLLGHLGHYNEGKKEIYKAAVLFGVKGRAYGIAVSQFDLSRVYEFESILDSAIYFAIQALYYWKPEADTFRILTISNQLINLWIKSDNLNQAKKVHVAIEPLLEKNDIHWMPLLDYYFLSARLFESLKIKEACGKYEKLYTDKIYKLKQKNITAKSRYDTQG